MITFDHVTYTYEGQTVPSLRDCSFTVEPGELILFTGESGCGKTTIIKLITAEIAPSGGRLMVNGYNLNNISPRQVPYMRRTLGIVFQDFRLLQDRNVYENVAFALEVTEMDPKEIYKKVMRVL